MKVTAYPIVAVLLIGALARANPPAAAHPEEKTLREAGVATDGPGLLAYIKAQTPSAAEQSRLADAVGQLGHRSFAVRERTSRTLVAAGRPSLSFLRPALDSSDLEVARRARRAIDDIERVPFTSVMTSVLHLLAERRPAGVVETLLGYVPFVEDEQVEEALRETIAQIGVSKENVHPAVRAALSDREPRRRAAAVHALGRAPTPPVKELLPLLKDPSPEVRLHAAEAVLRGRDRAGATVLIGLLEEAPFALARRAEDLLFLLSGDSGPPVSVTTDDAGRRKAREAWQTWWNANGERADLARITTTGVPSGLTLFCVYDSPRGEGKVWLTGADGKVRWEVGGLSGPNDARLLPGGRVLVAERNANRVTERDSTGKVLWQKQVDSGAIAAQRLPGGNTLITSWNQLLEVNSKGDTVWTYSHPGGFRHASRVNSGRIVAVAANGQVLELDRAGKLLRTITPERHTEGAGYWATVETIPGGRFLLALGTSGKVVEIDAMGAILWEATVPKAVFATRRSKGTTLVCSFEECQLVELDRGGKEVSRRRLEGRPFSVRRY